MSKNPEPMFAPAARTGHAAALRGLCLKLGLIGDNIAQSQAPLLHMTAGHLAGLAASYDRLVPRELDSSFDETFVRCMTEGYRGVNITYPYKEAAAQRVEIPDPTVRAMGAVNTVVFEKGGPKGFNTDYTGFIEAYRGNRGDDPAGRVGLIGAGGVGKAIAFGLLKLGLERLVIVDVNLAKADDLAARLSAASPSVAVTTAAGTEMVEGRLDGVINCTPVGMVGHEGTPVSREWMRGARWAFDAVYTPLDTPFLRDAAGEGLMVISGFELFLYQGVDAWQIFAGHPVDAGRLRSLLMGKTGGPQG